MLYLLVGVLALLLVIVRIVIGVCFKQYKKSKISTLVILGSGGHTAEMLQLTRTLDGDKYSPRTYVHADTDVFSADHAARQDPDGALASVPRAREVGQSWISTTWTTAAATLRSCLLLAKVRPDLILCNGPGTCVPFCLLSWLGNKAGLSGTKIVFVESICRVETLSLSGRILLRFADETLVQWPELADKYKGVTYVARFT